MIELAVVAPTFNEKGNVPELTARLERVLEGHPWEVVFVNDDSPDGTADAVRELAQSGSNVRCLHRIGRRGPSRAVVEGILATSAPYIAVIDADLHADCVFITAAARAMYATTPTLDLDQEARNLVRRECAR